MPELYVYGQKNLGLNLSKYLSWVALATIEGMVVWFVSWAATSMNRFGDNGLFALGDLCFTLGIVWTNYKLLVLETHLKTVVVAVAFLVTVSGWWAWNLFMASVYANNISPYNVKHGFTGSFGRDLNWWLGLVIAFAILVVGEMGFKAVKRRLLEAVAWPPWKRRVRVWRERNAEELDVGLWQEMEKEGLVQARVDGRGGGLEEDWDEHDWGRR